MVSRLPKRYFTQEKLLLYCFLCLFSATAERQKNNLEMKLIK